MKNPLIILDRDGVINLVSKSYVTSPDELILLPGSLEAIAKLNQAGFRVVVATNQSGVARGLYDIPMLNKVHNQLVKQLTMLGGQIEEFFFCPHHPDDHCNCRKPKPGMLQDIGKKYQIDLATTFFIGDSDVDVQAAHAAGCMPLLVLTGKGKQTLQNFPDYAKIVPYFKDLAAAVENVLNLKRE